MIWFLAAAVASVAAPASEVELRFNACTALAATDPAKAEADANSWLIEGGGVAARECLGLAFAANNRWLPASTAFEQAATQAEREKDLRATRLWIQAGNAALAGGQAPRARGFLDTALASGQLVGEAKGEAHLDRARALVALRQTTAARIDIDAALKLVPADPLGWLLSATLARRTQDLARATADISEAVRLSPDDAQVALEAGNIAVMNGSPEAARLAWSAAVKNAPGSPASKAAAEALKQFEAAPKP
jgi:Tetratricopeptide repeat